MTLEQLEHDAGKKRYWWFQDPFTGYHDAGSVADFIARRKKLGRRPVVLLPFLADE